MRPLGIHFIGICICIYLGCESFPDDFGRFTRFFPSANGRTYGPTDIQTNGHTDIRTHEHTDTRTYGRTDPLIEMRGRI